MAAICARCVMAITCLLPAISAIFSDTFCAVLPLIPVSISSNIRVGMSSVSAITDFNASMIRDSSPPEAISERGLSGSPGFVEMRNDTLSTPFSLSSVSVIATSNCTERKLRSVRAFIVLSFSTEAYFFLIFESLPASASASLKSL